MTKPQQPSLLGSLLSPPAGPPAPSSVAPSVPSTDVPWAGRPAATTPDPGWSSKLKKPVDLSFLPLPVLAMVQRAIDEGLTVATWQAWDKPYASVFGIKGGHLQSMEDEMLASGWGRYSGSLLVWGWYQ